MEIDVGLMASFGAGLVSFLSPCILPLVPSYLCFITGATLDELSDGDGASVSQQRRAFLAALAFVLQHGLNQSASFSTTPSSRR